MGLDYSELVEVAAHLHSVPARIKPAVAHTVHRAGNGTVTDAQVLVPIETSTLHDSIGVDFDPDDLGFVAGPSAYYGPYVEDGDSNNGPQPFMGPAFEGRVEDAEDDLAKHAYWVLA